MTLDTGCSLTTDTALLATDGHRPMDYSSLVDRLAMLDTCAVSDALDSIGAGGAVSGLKRRSTTATIAGRVQTIKLAAGKPEGGSVSHLGTRTIVESSAIDVIVVEQRTGIEAAGWGGVLATAAHHKGIRGVIVEGPARDIDEYERDRAAGIFSLRHAAYGPRSNSPGRYQRRDPGGRRCRCARRPGHRRRHRGGFCSGRRRRSSAGHCRENHGA